LGFFVLHFDGYLAKNHQIYWQFKFDDSAGYSLYQIDSCVTALAIWLAFTPYAHTHLVLHIKHHSLSLWYFHLAKVYPIA